MATVPPTSPLEHLDELTTGPQRGAVTIAEVPCATQLTVRARADSPAAEAIATELGVALPTVPNTVHHHRGCDVLWMGPDEWLLVGDEDEPGALERRLRGPLGAHPGAITEVSAQRTILEVGGSAARAVLARGCALDLHPAVFGPGRCAQTLLAQAGVVLQGAGPSEPLRVFVRASFATYLLHWLWDASLEERTEARLAVELELAGAPLR
ncbi:MAG TPA: sarcosine oxidase subunit gamma family protein [Solirubrobacteraceae bacterium]|nr:sarcosine oxidase subunit gamma family protein [Solirubrobacteraceae bacterium]